MSSTHDSSETAAIATIEVTNIPVDDEILVRAHLLASGAKTFTWCGSCEGTPMPDDSIFIRAALALLHMLDLSEAMSQAPAIVSMLASSFDPANDTPGRAKLFGLPLADPSAFLAEAVRTNRRLTGLPPQLDVIDGGES